MRHSFFCALLLLSLTACKPEAPAADSTTTSSSETTSPAAEEPAAASAEQTPTDSPALSLPFLSADEQLALQSLKQKFDEGIRPGFEQRPLSYAYAQHALRLSLDLLNEETFAQVFPYNGDFTLEQNKEQAQQLSFLSYYCGFQMPDGQSVINYFCLKSSSAFMDYLAELGRSNEIIDRAQNGYRTQKQFDPTIRQMVLLEADEGLDFENPGHQLFYFIYHSMINEEYQANLKAQRQM